MFDSRLKKSQQFRSKCSMSNEDDLGSFLKVADIRFAWFFFSDNFDDIHNDSISIVCLFVRSFVVFFSKDRSNCPLRNDEHYKGYKYLRNDTQFWVFGVSNKSQLLMNLTTFWVKLRAETLYTSLFKTMQTAYLLYFWRVYV